MYNLRKGLEFLCKKYHRYLYHLSLYETNPIKKIPSHCTLIKKGLFHNKNINTLEVQINTTHMKIST